VKHLLLVLAIGLLILTAINCKIVSKPKPPVVDMTNAHVTYDKSVP
jgi:hypothetical protein